MLRSIAVALLLVLSATSAWSAEYVQMTGEERYRRFCASVRDATDRAAHVGARRLLAGKVSDRQHALVAEVDVIVHSVSGTARAEPS